MISWQLSGVGLIMGMLTLEKLGKTSLQKSKTDTERCNETLCEIRACFEQNSG
jgi:hypothetical protein